MVHSDILAQALQKVRSILHGDAHDAQLTAQELLELRDSFLPRLNDPGLSERDRLSCEQVLGVVRDHWATAGPGDSHFPEGRDSGQHGFRATLDKFLQQRFAEVTREDLRMLRAVCNRFAQASGRTASHERLLQMITDCLGSYRAYLAETATGAPEESGMPAPEDTPIAEDAAAVLPDVLLSGVPACAPPETGEDALPKAQEAPLNVPSDGQRHRAGELLDALQRMDVDHLGDIPVSLRVRYCEVEGDHVIEGDIPEDVLVRVCGGGGVVEGCVLGHVHADGGVRVCGNVNGGWLISENGDIAAERVLMGTKLVARKGAIACSGVEGADKVIAAEAIRVAGDVRGGLLMARDVEIGGVLREGSVRCAGSLTAAAVESSARGGTCIALQRFVPVRVLGVEPAPEALKALRDLHAWNLRANVLQAFRAGLSAGRLHLMRAVLFETKAALMTDFKLADLRDAQFRNTYLPMVLALGQELHNGVLEACEMDGDSAGRAVVALADIASGLAAWLERELAAHTPGLLKQGRTLAEQSLRHIVSAAKRVREGVQKEGAAADALEALAEKLDEFEPLGDNAGREVDAFLEQCSRETFVHLADNLEALHSHMDEAAGAQSGKRQARELQELRAHIAHIDEESLLLDKQIAEACEMRDACRRDIAAAGAGIFADAWRGAPRISARRFSPGVLLTTSPLVDAARKMPMGSHLHITDALDDETVFERVGHCVRKIMNPGAESG